MTRVQQLARACWRVAQATSEAASCATSSGPTLVVNYAAFATSRAGSRQCIKRASSSSMLRRVNVSHPGFNDAAAAAAAADAAVSTSGRSGSNASFIEMPKEVPGGSKPLRSWEKWYWGLGVSGVSFYLYWRLKKPEKTPEEIEAARQKALELEAKRKEHLRAALMGNNWIEGCSDPLEGLTPRQIVQFMEKHGIDPSDPLEGLAPEEINTYVRQQEARRQQQAEQQ
eukprot:GHRR01010529.1.p1 GENE.GHRR01010529.1~~GHRR01010529.1.p1  ORF type:complete len:227 (+),score=66.17 GHRR01010529.1:55-735(+)